MRKSGKYHVYKNDLICEATYDRDHGVWIHNKKVYENDFWDEIDETPITRKPLPTDEEIANDEEIEKILHDVILITSPRGRFITVDMNDFYYRKDLVVKAMVMFARWTRDKLNFTQQDKLK